MITFCIHVSSRECKAITDRRFCNEFGVTIYSFLCQKVRRLSSEVEEVIILCIVSRRHFITAPSSAVTGLEWPRGFQEVKVPRFHDNGTGWW